MSEENKLDQKIKEIVHFKTSESEAELESFKKRSEKTAFWQSLTWPAVSAASFTFFVLFAFFMWKSISLDSEAELIAQGQELSAEEYLVQSYMDFEVDLEDEEIYLESEI